MAGVYFIRSGESGPIKIGFTIGDPRHRIEELQNGNHELLKLFGWLEVETPPPFVRSGRYCYRDVTSAACQAERALHRQFAEDRIRGEWFRPSRRLLRFIATTATREAA